MVLAEILWETKTCKPFITLTFGKLFQEAENSILTGGEDGIVRVYDPPSRIVSTLTSVRSLETKCGPIFHLQLHDIIRLVSQDLIAADSRGSVIVFCNGQIFMRTMPEKAAGITSMQICESELGHLFIITGNEDGVVNCFNAFDNLWKIRLQDIMSEKMRSSQPTLSVTCMLSTTIFSDSCPPMGYVVVADSDKNLHFIQNGRVLVTITTPAVVRAMVAGHFLHFDEVSDSDEKVTQIALGCDDGTIWICADFEVHSSTKYSDVGHPITHLHRLPPMSDSLSTGVAPSDQAATEKLDILLCGGHFSALLVLREGKVLTKLRLPDWMTAICNYDRNEGDARDGRTILIGCQDSTIQAVKVS